MPPAPYLFLSLPDTQSTSFVAPPAGGRPDSGERFLNVTGRWAVRPADSAPLLVWLPTEEAQAHAAAKRAAEAHRRAVTVCLRTLDDAAASKDLQRFDDSFEAALQGPAPQSAAKARRLRTEADKLEAFCMVVRAASTAADHAAFADVSRAASKALRAKFGGGSITSAFAWLAGPAGHRALASVLAGEVELSGPLSVRQVIEAAALAQEAEQLRSED